ncbi:hypothetical protein BJY52DRAFT_164681 [Lactarius psammicola]|nr:hypothetical protein BJY52DRAFT_164681 [Lactarius psammicola]
MEITTVKTSGSDKGTQLGCLVVGPAGPKSPFHVLCQLSFSLFSWVDCPPRVIIPGNFLYQNENAAGRADAIEDILVDLGIHLVLMDPYRIDGPVRSGPTCIIFSHHSLEYSWQPGEYYNGGMPHSPATKLYWNPARIRNSLLLVNTSCIMSYKHGQAVISGPWAHTPSVVGNNLHRGTVSPLESSLKVLDGQPVQHKPYCVLLQYSHYRLQRCNGTSVAPPDAYPLDSSFFINICEDLTSRWPKLWDLTERGGTFP